MSEIAIAVRLDADADAAELQDATSQLRRELLELDVDAVKAPAGGEAPLGTRGAVGAEIGTLLVAAGNLIANPSFEQGKSGWGTFHSVLSSEQVPDAPDGQRVVRVLATGPGELSMDDPETTDTSSVAGRRYTAAAWVKAGDETDGQLACLGIRESDAGDNFVGGSYSALTLSSAAYRQLRVVYKARASGHRIDVLVYIPRSTGSAGDSFLADAISLTRGDRGSTEGPDCP
jgi:hypothetical protein